ncbi:twin-arginine translocase TatA/TatE family subunit [Gilvibacter sp.]|uniref:Sec-independent protein translocase subunit TatA/TatB n=1 Tax=Gilvibacter sp. TaxID=2729997 RepID=UPI0025BD274F|nr:twin-arginine translocase TatA/TatE family subunit [Gilvibacter sp.]NQX76547.1 twin-arginine translocase TatA/TatE family subunit [Gilvibacter sp.]
MQSFLIFGFISTPEVMFILFIVLLVFGADKIPTIARGLGKGMRQIKDATNEIKSEITKSAEQQGIDTSIVKDVQDSLHETKKSIEQVSGTIGRDPLSSSRSTDLPNKPSL